jgi:hypothetical protein
MRMIARMPSLLTWDILQIIVNYLCIVVFDYILESELV